MLNKRSSANHCKHHQSQNHNKNGTINGLWGCVRQVFTGIQPILLLLKKNAQVSFRPFSCKRRFVNYQFTNLVSDIVINTGSMRWGKPKRISRFNLRWYMTKIFGLVLFAFHTEGPSCGHMFTFSSPQMIRPLAGMECFLCGRPSPLLDDAIQMP